MKQTFFTAMMLLAGYATQAQVGVNTLNPQGMFNIDGAKDNPVAGAPTAAQQANDFIFTAAGNVGIGNTTPASKLEVNGSSTNTRAFYAGTGTTIDFSNSNLAYTTAPVGAFTISNIKDGGTYTLGILGSPSGTATFTSPGFTVKYVNNRSTIAGKDTLYTFIVMGTAVYVYTASGF